MTVARFSIGQMMLIVFLIALSIAGMLRPSRLAAGLALSVVIVALTRQTLAALMLRDAGRNFALGFAAGGWIFFLVHFLAFFTFLSPTFVGNDGTPPILPTTSLLDFLYPRIVEGVEEPVVMMTAPAVEGGTRSWVAAPKTPGAKESAVKVFWSEIDRGNITVIPRRSQSFSTIGFSIFTLAFAIVCGLLCSRLGARSASGPRIPPS